ncbi:MAG: head GIN domain-containing protein [Christiangramia sp.]|nr:DUF2807 domain-containing protein [Christiangramia sp.]
MKKAILILASILFTISSVQAQWWSSSEKVKGNGNVVTKSRSTGDYDGVQLVGSMNVQLVAGNEGQLKIEAESNLQEYITTEVKAGTLKISTKKGVDLRPTKEILITVPFESISQVSLTGSGDIWTRDQISSSSFGVSVTGSGDVVLDINAGELKGAITGSGDIKLKGQARNFDCTVTGSGDFAAYDLRAESVNARVAGSGDIQVYASASLTATVSGSGDIMYKGDPEKQNFKSSGSGDISAY